MSEQNQVLTTGFNAFGKPVPESRKQAAYDCCKEMGLSDNEKAWGAVNGMSDCIERDKPFEAQQLGMQYLDLTGTYRLMAVLCTDKAEAA